MVEITVELDTPREVMYEEMCELVGEDELDAFLTKQFLQMITTLYDTKDE